MAKKQAGFGTFFHGILSRLQDAVEDVAASVREKISLAIGRLIRELAVLAFLLIGAVFALVGFALFVNERLVESKGLSFLIVGLLIIVIALLYRSVYTQRR